MLAHLTHDLSQAEKKITVLKGQMILKLILVSSDSSKKRTNGFFA